MEQALISDGAPCSTERRIKTDAPRFTERGALVSFRLRRGVVMRTGKAAARNDAARRFIRQQARCACRS